MRDENEEVAQPLISGDRDVDVEGNEQRGIEGIERGIEQRGGDGDGNERGDRIRDGKSKAAIEKEVSRFIWLLTLTACLSGLLFGYDTGIISSTLLSLNTSLGHVPTTLDLSLITSSTSLAALLASPTAGWAADLWGRKAVIGVSCGGFVLGAFIQAGAWSVLQMVVGRAVVGAAVGGASGIVPLYISETSPPSRRGSLVTVQSLTITFGQVLAYILGWLSRGSWRYAVGFGAVPAILQAVLLVSLPESPRWLVLQSQDTEAKTILLKLGSREDEAESIIERVRLEAKTQVASGSKGKLKDLFGVEKNRKALGVACGLQSLQQLCGFNSLMYFSATIFSLVGFTSPIGVSLCVAMTNFVFTFFAFGLIDRIGRRRILLLSIPVMVVGLGVAAGAFGRMDLGGRGEGFSASGSGAEMGTGEKGNVWPGVLVAATILYVAAYATGLGCVPWQQAELFCLSVRSVGSGLATATNWSSNFLVGATFLPMMERLGPAVTFGVYAFVCVLGWFWVWRFYPEVGGRGLEDGVTEVLQETED